MNSMNSMNSVKLRKITLVSSFHELLAHLAAGCIDAGDTGDTKKRCDPICIAVLEICPAIQCIDHCPQGAVAIFFSGRG